MLQVICRIHLFGHVIPIYGYGLMLVVAFFACIKTAQWLARRNRINPELMVNAALVALVTGMIGARLCHVIENFRDYTRSDLSVWANFLNIVNTREGGLTFYGGFLLATPCCILYARLHRIPVLRGMDIVAPTLMIGLAIGRIGCFLNGCCYGAQCDLPWAARFPYYSNAYIEQFEEGLIVPPERLYGVLPDGGVALLPPGSAQFQNDPELGVIAAQNRAMPVQPAELYSAFTGFLLAGLLIAYLTLGPSPGRVFALMLILEGISRYVLEMIRVEPSVVAFHWHGERYGLSISMILAVILVWAGLTMWRFLPTTESRASKAGLRLEARR
jgi:phosphatidylglycerol---prolipoprotein diacylglyceryl transferase